MRRLSPSFAVSVIAVVLATAGTSIAAVNFAKNSGAVDGKSAVSASSSQKHAAGKLVATANEGTLRGKVPARFLDLSGVVSGSKQSFAQGIEVVDNQTSAPVSLGGVPNLGILTATCNDQAGAAGKEDPQVTLTFANGSGNTVNFTRQVGIAQPAVTAVAAATQETFTINGSNTFRVYVQFAGINYVVEGAVRQDGANTATGVCAVWGYALVI
jgi:hypothetical protein